ncbi:Replication protein A 70 kDa DNA-binding subunit [Astathelohania contejeani]|uniref:Replication protein A subunit n=1 Tax=Astathelohania contejeani TaxID=164912 RepID=A0ABQ7I1U1_9MICR|nr:Replication protein A 70 kDa DNA-binding subunit [Thelohania contejeani]
MKLEAGTVEAIYNNQKNNPLYSKPVLQVIGLERVSVNCDDKARYRVNLSDGKYYLKGIFSSAYTHHINKKLIKIFSLVKLAIFQVRSKNESYYVYIQEVEEYEDETRRIGNPMNISNKKLSQQNDSQTKIVKEVEKITATKPAVAKPIPTVSCTPIAALNPFQTKWTIRGSVVAKSEIRHFTNQKGEGKFFNIELADETGQIKIVAFSEAADIFYSIFEIGRIYTISRGTIKMANKQFSNNNSDYEIHLDKNSEVTQSNEEIKPKYYFKFIPINELTVGNNLTDVIGIVRESFPSTTVTVRSTQKETTKRDLILMDKTGNIRVTLWGSKTELDLDAQPVMAIKGVRVGEYNGVLTLSTVASSQVILNPEIDDAFALRGWFESVGKDIKIEIPKREEKIALIREAREQESDFATIMGIVMFIKEDNLWYDSCIGENCNKKVINEDDGNYRCEKCNRIYDKCNYRYMVNINVGDFSGQLWLTLFDDMANKFFDTPAANLKEISETNSTGLQKIIKVHYAKRYIFRIRRRNEVYNNESRLKFNVMNMEKIDYLKESQKLLDVIRKAIR